MISANVSPSATPLSEVENTRSKHIQGSVGVLMRLVERIELQNVDRNYSSARKRTRVVYAAGIASNDALTQVISAKGKQTNEIWNTLGASTCKQCSPLRDPVLYVGASRQALKKQATTEKSQSCERRWSSDKKCRRFSKSEYIHSCMKNKQIHDL